MQEPAREPIARRVMHARRAARIALPRIPERGNVRTTFPRFLWERP